MTFATEIVMEPRGKQLVERYKQNYSITDNFDISEQMVLAHWELEKQLTKELLNSTLENRWQVFENSYTRLYQELEWLNRARQGQDDATEDYETWAKTIGAPPQTVYEIGSGQGQLIQYLASCGFDCKGTEITRERGQKHLNNPAANIQWGQSDGVHLERFEPDGHYDVVISSQVIEHLHPDDLNAHFKGCYKILKPQGRYIFTTPHCYTGPHDVSSVFNYDVSRGMHLKEYTYAELLKQLQAAGYRQVYASIPLKFRRLFAKLHLHQEAQMIKVGEVYLQLLLVTEAVLGLVPQRKLQRSLSKFLKQLLLFRDNIFLVAQK